MSEAEFTDALVPEFDDKIIELGGEDAVMAYFAEPVMGAGGVIVPPEGYNQRMWGICKKYDILYLSDEVVTGFGRVGHMLASEPMFGLEPDIITCAKGLTSGYVPLGVTLIGHLYREGELLSVAQRLLEPTGFHEQRPPLFS